jgi:hypothetical protein
MEFYIQSQMMALWFVQLTDVVPSLPMERHVKLIQSICYRMADNSYVPPSVRRTN